MPLKLVLGPANAAKAGELLGAFTAASPRGPLLVVPTAADVRHYTRELAGDAVLLGTVTTFSGLVDEIARRTAFAAPRLSAIQRAHLLQRAVGRLDLGAFADSAGASGFAAAAGALIAELGRALVTPQRFAAALRTWAGEDPARRPHADDLAAICFAYRRELERSGRLDPELFAHRALDALRERPAAWGTTPVYLYGFDDLTGLEHDAIETLARVVGVEVAVSLTYEPGRLALGARAGVVEELRPLAGGAITELPALDAYYAPDARGALHHLERFLFAPGPERIDPGDAITLLEAGGERAEAELVADRVLQLIRVGGYAPGEIVVVTRSLAASGLLFERVFRRFGIPYTSERPIAFATTTLGRALLALARCALGPESVRTAGELVRYLRAPGLIARAEVIDALEADGLRHGVPTARDLRQRALHARLGASAEDLAAFEAIDRLAAASDPGAELLAAARRLFAAPRRGRAAVLGRVEEPDARALTALVRALEELAELVELDGPRASGGGIAGSELIELLETLELPGDGAPIADAVTVAEPLGIRARRFRAVFVCGLCEGAFPRPATPEPFLSDERRRELAIASGLVLAPREDGLAAERYLFYASISRATERLFLSYRSSDEEGNLVLASPFVADVAELLEAGWSERRHRRLLADITFSPEHAPTPLERARADAAARGRAAAPVEPPPGRLSERGLAHVRHREVVSGGALEAFADCPVKWLVSRQLEPLELAPDPEALTRGSVMHEALERVLRELGAPLTPATLPAAERILDAVLSAQDDSAVGQGRPPALRRAMLVAIAADLHRYLRHEAARGNGWRPRELELRFGFDDALPPLRLGEGEDEVILRGVIDRVDVDESDPARPRAIVRDYKSGAIRDGYRANQWHAERQLQVALYMLAVRDLMALEPVAGFYQPLRGRELRARGAYEAGLDVGSGVYDADGREPGELGELLAQAAADAVEITKRLRTGVLEPCPHTCSRDGCLFPGICRSS